MALNRSVFGNSGIDCNVLMIDAKLGSLTHHHGLFWSASQTLQDGRRWNQCSPNFRGLKLLWGTLLQSCGQYWFSVLFLDWRDYSLVCFKLLLASVLFCLCSWCSLHVRLRKWSSLRHCIRSLGIGLRLGRLVLLPILLRSLLFSIS